MCGIMVHVGHCVDVGCSECVGSGMILASSVQNW